MNQAHQALAEHIDTELSHDIGEVTAVGWHGPVNMTFDEWVRIGNTLQQIGNSINWWIGDWLNYGEAKWGEMYAQAIEITGWEYNRLANAKYVAANIQFSLRNENLSWTHHYNVAKLSSDKQRYWLTLAESENMASNALRDAIRQSQLPIRIIDEDDSLPFSSATPQVYPSENTNGHRTPVEEYEQQTEHTNGYRLAAANHAISDDPDYDGDEWYTPEEYIEAARQVMGSIDLDPATSHDAQIVIKAKNFYTKDDDGLLQEWHGNVWMNPPYSNPLINHFIDKLLNEYESGHINQAVVLTNNSSDTRWFHSMLSRFPACFTRGRVQFWRPNLETFGTRQGQAIFYIGKNILRFDEFFSEFGVVVTKL